MRRPPLALLAASLLALAGCPHERVAPPPPPPPAIAESTPAPIAPPPVEIVESPPAETPLDHADVPNAADVWVEMIRGAKKTLDIAHFYISNAPGSKLEPVLAAIEEAAARGVRVRLLMDAKFYAKYPESVDRLGAREGIEVRKLDLGPKGGVLHAKYFIVDGGEVYLGSQNMDWRALEHIHEIGARIRVPEVDAAFVRVFELDWASAGGASAPPPGDAKVDFRATVAFGDEKATLLPAASPKDLLPPGVAWDLPELLARIDGASRSVDVQVLTYGTKTRSGATWTELDDALRRAAGRGVAVRMLVSDWSKREKSLEPLRALARVPGISIHFIVIPQSSSGFIPFARVAHAKYMIVDGKRAWIGTSNWEGDYFTSSRNVSLFVDGETLAGRLDRIFEDAFGGPLAEPLDPDRAYEPPRIE